MNQRTRHRHLSTMNSNWLTEDRFNHISVVVPCYNSRGSLDDLVSELKVVLEEHFDQYEIVLVNDGSTDDSLSKMKLLLEQYDCLRVVNLSRNFGQHNATLCGLHYARYEQIVTIDDDLQNPPHEIPCLIQELQRGFDVVYGKPLKNKHGLIRDFCTQAFKIFFALVAPAAQGIGSFRALRSSVLAGMSDFSGRNVCVDALFTWSTNRISSVSVEHRYRGSGYVSRYSFRSLCVVAIDLMFAYKSVPFKPMCITGLVLSAIGLLLFVCSLCLFAGHVAHILAASVLFVGGLQLFGIGAIGEYILRMQAAACNQPPYVVAEEYSSSTVKDSLMVR